MLMKIYTCVCVSLVPIHSFPTSWFLPREEEVLKSYRKKKLSLLIYPESGSAHSLKRETVLQKLELYYYKQRRIQALSSLYILKGL